MCVCAGRIKLVAIQTDESCDLCCQYRFLGVRSPMKKRHASLNQRRSRVVVGKREVSPVAEFWSVWLRGARPRPPPKKKINQQNVIHLVVPIAFRDRRCAAAPHDCKLISIHAFGLFTGIREEHCGMLDETVVERSDEQDTDHNKHTNPLMFIREGAFRNRVASCDDPSIATRARHSGANCPYHQRVVAKQKMSNWQQTRLTSRALFSICYYVRL